MVARAYVRVGHAGCNTECLGARRLFVAILILELNDIIIAEVVPTFTSTYSRSEDRKSPSL
jgi:hypothetical protein